MYIGWLWDPCGTINYQLSEIAVYISISEINIRIDVLVKYNGHMRDEP